MASECNRSNADTTTQDTSDTIQLTTDTLSMNVDSAVVKMDSVSPVNTGTKVDTIAKDVKYGTSTGKHEAPKHDSPNQEKIDSIKQAKKKKK
jgi:hypothetical protein